MSADQTASLIYLMLLGTVIASYFFLSNRQSLGRTMRQAGLWVLIFIGAIVAYGLWDDLRDTVLPQQSVFAEEGRVEVPLSSDGHYHMVLRVNGTPVEFVIDTGASDIVLTREDAERAGIATDDLPFSGVANTANGTVRTARVRLDEVSLGGITDQNVPAVINGGEMWGSLLGMAYLNRFAEVTFGRGKMILTR
ncbi:retropepsin-like aspartic protease family protein [Tropicimonas isoalkanivorans]|uniref:Aspartyl protease family protein n=1 Tax=Tropicimonas isoalkanivorans TaxID=441112 RepID=A0A1I1DU92_9RHOB|nr:TIGR02281 family clan AA aspartic protease [Tropicimonas isoalkanivorans]SFB78609.1 aspartyl protease family protein [Tropicimonas isoalkanivorans]